MASWNRVDARIENRLVSITKAEWNGLFETLPDSYEMMCWIEECGFDGFALKSLVVRGNGRPILLLPLYQHRYEVTDFLSPGFRRVVAPLRALAAPALAPRFLGIGFVASDWNEIGFDRRIDPATLRSAWDAAFDCLDTFMSGERVQMFAYPVLDSDGGAGVPLDQLSTCTEIEGEPWFCLPTSGFSTIEGYLGSLSKSSRKALRRKLRQSSGLRVERTKDAAPHFERICELYQSTLSRSERVVGRHPDSFFLEVCRRVPETEFVLYFSEKSLLAFNLLAVHRGTLVDKLFCMDPNGGRDLNLYFASWFENVKSCILNGYSIYNVGASTEETKLRLGAQAVPTKILFRHRSAVIGAMFSRLQKYMAYKPPLGIGSAELGRFWQSNSGLSGDSGGGDYATA